MAKLSKDQRGKAVELINAEIRQAELSVNYLHYYNYRQFFKFYRKYP